MVLGSMKSNHSWYWAACGKHPVARDFFMIGHDHPLLKSFSDWVEKGYGTLASQKNALHQSVSWRFWARGSQKDILICGLVRDSSDSIGRPYPLLIIGKGSLKDWEEHWDLLPFACEKTWSQTEFLSAHMISNFKQLESGIQNIRSPHPDWSGFHAKRDDLMEKETSEQENASWDFKAFENRASNMSEKTEGFICLDQKPFHDQFALISFWHFLLKSRGTSAPNVLFMGGTTEKADFVFFKRPLVPGDFIQLWSNSSPEVRENGSLIAG